MNARAYLIAKNSVTLTTSMSTVVAPLSPTSTLAFVILVNTGLTNQMASAVHMELTGHLASIDV